ncbi:MAG TPA: hypothetical protein VGB64_11890 [Actinomycetota bacterium]
MPIDPHIRRIGFTLATGAAIILAGLLLPWVGVDFELGGQSGSITQAGLSTDDGKIVLVIAVLIELISVPFLTGRIRRTLPAGIGALLLATIATLVGFADIADIRSGRAGAVSARVGIGLYVSTAGAIVALSGAITAIRARRHVAAIAAATAEESALPPVPPGPPTERAAPAPPPTLPSEQPPSPPAAP